MAWEENVTSAAERHAANMAHRSDSWYTSNLLGHVGR